MRLSSIAARIERLEKLEASRPQMPCIVLILRDLRKLQRVYANGFEILRRQNESGKELVARARRMCPPSKKYVSMITSEPTNPANPANQ